MSLLNEVQKFIEAHPGCTSGDIADAFAGYSRQRVLQSASKLRQSGRFIFHRFLAEQALEFFNLLHGGSKFRGRNNLFSGGDSSKTSFLVLLTPEK